MATYGADYLRRLQTTVSDFEAAFEAWMQTQVEGNHSDSRGIFPTAWPRDDADPAEVRSRELAVAEAAGAAARAVAVTGAYFTVAGRGALDPIANWSLMTSPRALFAPSDIRTTAATIRGRLRTMIDEAETAAATELPAFAPSQLHPTIWAAAAAHWTTHHYRVAVREAAEALTQDWKAKLGRNDVDDTVFWQQTLSAGDPTPERPKVRWPGDDPKDKTVKGIREGLNHLASGLNLTVRNVTTHTRVDLSEQEGMERLAAYSYFARLLDQCEVLRDGETDAGS
ncbi:TIGR02391 family protein [Cellulomonas sp.]|uniref:TIGR02391 family protein n=1 Tax=Cellulomonas sp. TaxID=40001 RepID=UPI0028113534|nr:TIGR02391 family protein [Cellulomonas sp.]